MLQCFCSVWPATACSLMRATAGFLNTVDLYNGAAGTWSTAQLSVGRNGMAAATVGNAALFAGGQITGALLCRERTMSIVACLLSACACCSVVILFALRPLSLSCAPLQVVVLPMLWTCTTVQQGRGRRLSSAWRAIVLQLHLLGTWLCSLGVIQEVRWCDWSGRGGRGLLIVACVLSACAC